TAVLCAKERELAQLPTAQGRELLQSGKLGKAKLGQLLGDDRGYSRVQRALLEGAGQFPHIVLYLLRNAGRFYRAVNRAAVGRPEPGEGLDEARLAAPVA